MADSGEPVAVTKQDPVPVLEDQSLGSANSQPAKKEESKGGKGGKGGRGGRGGPVDREVTVSKALSWILRHGAAKEGLVLDKEGFARVDELVCLLFPSKIMSRGEGT
jgi:RNA:NAD 2'-phosphotransferase (TPT1/KptA family)